MSEARNADVQTPAETTMSGTPPHGGVVERGLLIGGKSVPASSGKLADDICPWDGQVYARVAAGTPADITRAADAAQAAFPAWSADGGVRATRHLPAGRRGDGRARRGGDRRLGCGDRGVPAVRGVQPGVLHPGAARGRGGDHPPGRRAAADLDPGGLLPGPAGPVRRGGGDLPVERAAGPRHPVHRHPAGRRQHGRDEAQRGRPDHLRAAAGRCPDRSRAPARGPQRRHQRPGRRRRRGRRPHRRPAGADGELHRLDRRRAPHRGPGRPAPQAGGARARREEPADHPGRCRPGPRGRRRRLRGVHELRAAVHVHRPDHHPPQPGREIHPEVRGAGQRAARRRPRRSRHDRRAPDQHPWCAACLGARQGRRRQGRQPAHRRRDDPAGRTGRSSGRSSSPA